MEEKVISDNSNGKYSSLTDEEAVKLAQNSDRRALDFILSKYKTAVKIKSRQYYIAGADREDLIQEGMIGLYKAVLSFEPGQSSFYSFAGLCIERQILSAVKGSLRQKHAPLNSYISINDEDKQTAFENVKGCSSPEEIIIRKEEQQNLKNNMENNLSGFENRVLLLLLCGHSYAEIAKTLDVSQKSVDNALQRVRKKLGASIALFS